MADSTPENWRRVDDYLAATLLDDDPALTAARSDSLAAGLPAIEVTRSRASSCSSSHG